MVFAGFNCCPRPRGFFPGDAIGLPLLPRATTFRTCCRSMMTFFSVSKRHPDLAILVAPLRSKYTLLGCTSL